MISIDKNYDFDYNPDMKLEILNGKCNFYKRVKTWASQNGKEWNGKQSVFEALPMFRSQVLCEQYDAESK